MATDVKKVRIFVASPGDVQLERDHLVKVVNELNLTISALSPEKRITLELVRWETHTYGGMGDGGGQSVVDEQIGDYDVFIGILWKRMGTPTTTAQSGTEQEFRNAYTLWQQNRTLPILFYFCQQPFPPPRTPDEVDQLHKVVRFREELSSKGLVFEYASHDGFADLVRQKLVLALADKFFSKGTQVETAKRVGELSGKAEISAVRAQILNLANRYEEIRRTMPGGDDRTREMELLASRLRSLALPAYPLLDEFTRSESSGQRLAAVSILEAIPTPAYLPWLSERIVVERRFIVYHALIALLNATRNLGASNRAELQEAVHRARQNLDRMGWKDPNQIAVLENAEKELNLLAEAKR
jgi:hypothetical protein